MSTFTERLGWMLLHSLWEGAVVWLLLQLALLALRKKSAQARYLAACFALAAMALLPWMTFSSIDLTARLQSGPASVVSVPAPLATAVSSDVAPAFSATGAPDLSRAFAPRRGAATVGGSIVDACLPWLVGAWALGVLIFAGRLWISWRAVRRLARAPLPKLPTPWQWRLAELCRTAGIRSVVRAGETALVAVPLVVGWLKPVILLPLGVLAQFPTPQIEAILLHELAHIRRHDFLVNLLQSVVETLFFYHPAVRSISRRMREERERACDDLSVEWCRDPVIYAEALTTFEEYRQRSLALAVTGEGDLLSRVRRIIFRTEPKPRIANFFAAAGFLALGGYLASMFLAPLLAAELMTDQERVAKIEALQPPANPANTYGPTKDVFVTGTLRTEDGKPLPPSLFETTGQLKQSEAKVASSRFGGTSSGGLSIEYPLKTYYGNTQSGRIEVGVWAEGYAPLRKTILQDHGGKVTADLILRRGFPASVQITDPGGHPLAGVTLTATSSGGVTSPLEISMPSVQTDASGLATFGQVESNTEIHLNAFKPGWQMMNQIVSQWSPQTPSVLQLTAAKPTSGTVIDQATRQPIVGAEVILAGRRGTGDAYVTFDPKQGQVFGHSDSQGRFQLESLSQNPGYYIYVQAPGYATQSFPIDYGQQDRVCELSRGFRLSGKILDPKGLLSSDKYFHPIGLQLMYTLQATPFNGYGQSTTQTLAKLGPEIPFTFENVPPGRAGLAFAITGLDQYRYELNMRKDVDDYVIDLAAGPPAASDEPRDPRPLRILHLTFQTDDQEPLTGSLAANYLTTKGDEKWLTPKTADIQDGRATLALPVPTTAWLSADQIAGYWFAAEHFDVPTGSEPFSRTIQVTRAGVIHGNISPSPAFENQLLSVLPVVIQAPPKLTITDLTSGMFRPLSPHHDFVTQPLPFGGTYAVIVNAAPSYFMTDPAVVDATHPIIVRDLALKLPDTALRGRFVDAANQPIRYQEVMLIYHPDANNAFLSHSATTGEDGSFTISGVNFSIPGNYEVQIYGDDWKKSPIRIDGHSHQPVTIPLERRAR